MEKLDANIKIEHLIKTLNYYTKLYDMGTPAISDAEWDKMYFELVELERQYPSLIHEDSPTQKIRYEVVNELKKIKHEYQPMLSLDKTKDIEDIEDKFRNKQWIAMAKCDGLSCRLIYQDGRLSQAATRGNGEIGEDITHNARVVKNIPQWIPHNGRLIIDGEIVCLAQDFVPFAKEYANSRNFASGSIRLLDSAESAKRNLSFIAWDCIYDDESESSLLSQQLENLEFYGFDIVNYGICEVSVEEAIEFLKRSADAEGLPIDGIVFKLDNKSQYYAAGTTGHHPKAAIAYKFYDEEYETELVDIEWGIGKTSILTPVAIYKDIEIDGTVCNRASLHNINTMEQLLGDSPYVGQKIWIYKANQINPQVSKAELAEDIGGIDEKNILHIPSICPMCLGETEVRTSDSGTIELYCANEMCSGKLINKLDYFCGKRGLDIKHFSKATLEKLIDWGWVTKAKDIFYLYQHEREWVTKTGFGEKSVKRILDAIEEARHCSLEAFICALSIPLIGKTYAKQLAQIYEDYNTFREAILQGENFSQLDGFGPAMHEAIITFDYSEADEMVDMGIVDIKSSELPKIGNALSLENLSFCITGKLHAYKNRDEIKALILSLGGKVTDSVTSKTNYLINNDINSTSAKNKKAKELNIPIITEEDFQKLV